jgi:hypothetical protein
MFMVAPACEPAVVSFTCAGAAKRDFERSGKAKLEAAKDYLEKMRAPR